MLDIEKTITKSIIWRSITDILNKLTIITFVIHPVKELKLFITEKKKIKIAKKFLNKKFLVSSSKIS